MPTSMWEPFDLVSIERDQITDALTGGHCVEASHGQSSIQTRQSGALRCNRKSSLLPAMVDNLHARKVKSLTLTRQHTRYTHISQEASGCHWTSSGNTGPHDHHRTTKRGARAVFPGTTCSEHQTGKDYGQDHD